MLTVMLMLCQLTDMDDTLTLPKRSPTQCTHYSSCRYAADVLHYTYIQTYRNIQEYTGTSIVWRYLRLCTSVFDMSSPRPKVHSEYMYGGDGFPGHCAQSVFVTA